MPPEMEEGLSTSASPTDTSSDVTPDSNGASSTPDSEVGSSPQDTAVSKDEGKAATTSADAVMDALALSSQTDKPAATAEDKSKAETPPASADAKPEPTKDDKPQAKPDDKAKEDELYRMPEGLRPVAQERFKQLAAGHREMSEKLKTIETERDTYRMDSEGFRTAIEYSGAEPEEFRELLEYSHSVKNGNYEAALAILDKHRSQLAKFVAKPVAGVDQFAEFPDLKQQVDAYELPVETALEVAQARRQRAAMERAQQQQQVTQQQQHASQQEINTAIDQISSLEKGWKANDIDFAAKAPLLVKQTETICKQYPPHLWKQAMTDFYNSLSTMKAPNPPLPNTQPLRPGGRGGNPEPRNSTDAVSRALGLS